MKKVDYNDRAALCQEYYDTLITPLRYVAYRCGYCIGVHGSLKRDIDLICIPWRDSAISAESLIENLRKATEAIVGFAVIPKSQNQPEKKPCGRLAWIIWLTSYDGNGPYLDISIMPVKGDWDATRKLRSSKKNKSSNCVQKCTTRR